ncbi:DUF5723 family protein [Mucilaginibacter sp. UYCu711]|uniref:DUF5723 family protein n=1 Tax=Mucilaginibacter sp. UYCu711 TaxID=3156339 RepID=UPI003D206081
MKKGLLVWCFFLVSVKVFGQQFAQYNTGSLYDSFENPAQRAFIPDTTKQFAFNFFIPNFSTNFYVAGNGQAALKTRAFESYYNTANLEIGKGAYNRINLNANSYFIMFKLFASEDGDQEAGFSFSTKAEARGVATDESIALFNGFKRLNNANYTNIFNDQFFYQAYHQISFTYREQLTKQFAFGAKFSALSGLSYGKVNIYQSSISLDQTNDAATLSLQGTTYASSAEGQSNAKKILPSFRNPGAAISIGTSYRDESGYKWQLNLKDLGFIHWSSKSLISNFEGSKVLTDFSSSEREKIITNGLDSLTTGSQVKKGFTSPTNGLLELSINKTYWIGGDHNFTFSPTIIGSKEVFYPGFTAALVAPIQHNNFIGTVTASYNDLKLFNLGVQFMVKKDNSEFFIGSERVFQTGQLLGNAIHSATDPDQTQVLVNQGGFTGMDFYIGVSFKFGSLIERRLNSSSIPNGDKGFVGKIWDSIFGKKDKNY